MSGRDYQRSRVYAWEDAVVGPRDRSQVAFCDIPAIVAHIWQGEGLSFPPAVEPLPKSKKVIGTASRVRVCFHENQTVATWVIIHEIAHALTSTVDRSGEHGPAFVGVYMRLLTKYMNLPMPLLIFTATESKIDFDLNARYAFLDD